MKNILLLIASIVFIEMSLQVACQISPSLNSIIFIYDKKDIKPIAVRESQVVNDDELGLKGNPKYFDHDARGYRNVESLKSADIVAIGDSHTYGSSVARHEAWPFLIEKYSGIKTYNMGFGGYGPAHYFLQLDKVIELSPEFVIVGIYFGNDFYDNFKLAKVNEKITTFLSADELKTIEALEEKSKLVKEARKLFPGLGAPKNEAKRNRVGTEDKSGARIFLSHYSALYGLTRAVKNIVYEKLSGQHILLSRDFEVAKANLTKEQLKYFSVFEGQDGWRTIFTSLYRGIANDRKDPRIDIGFGLTSRILVPIKRRVVDSGAKLLVVLLPTKESVFSRKVPNPDSHIGYSDLVHNENSNREEIKQFLVEKEMSYIDLQPYLQKSEEQPYFSNLDGHPNALGHRIIADVIIDWINDNS